MSKHFYFLKFLIVISFLLLVLFPSISNTSASPSSPTTFIVTKQYYNSSTNIPSDLQNAPNCPRSCNVTGVCVNSENDGNCGATTCDGGNAWTKYNLISCKQIDYNAILDELTCKALYTQSEIVYSIGDKCVAGEPGLRSSSCTAVQSSSMYKVCCTDGTPSFLTSQSCRQFAGDTTNPPYEGECPSNTHWVRCGDNGIPCTQTACGATSTPVATPVATTPGDTCTNMTCTYSELDSSCASGVKVTTGRGCTGFNCGCNFVNSCSTSECTTPVATPAPSPTPTAAPISQPAYCDLNNECNGDDCTFNLNYYVSNVRKNDFQAVLFPDANNKPAGGMAPDNCSNTSTSRCFTSNPTSWTYSTGTYTAEVAVTGSEGSAVCSTQVVVAPDNPPSCLDFRITDTSGNSVTSVRRGTQVVLRSSLSDNDDTKVSFTELYLDGILEAGPFTNGLNSQPFNQTINFSTSGLGETTHTFTINAQDTAGNTMFGDNNACHKTLTIIPPTTWLGPSCGVSDNFIGCAQSGQLRCTDLGDGNSPEGRICLDACSRANPDTYCRSDTLVTSNPVVQGCDGTQPSWPLMDIRPNLQTTDIGNVYFQPGACSSATCGNFWTEVERDVEGQFNWDPNTNSNITASTSGSPFTFGLFDQSSSNILATYTTTFRSINPASCLSPVTPPAPPPSGSGCEVAAEGSGGNTNWVIYDHPSAESSPVSPRITVDGVDQTSSIGTWRCADNGGSWECFVRTAPTFYTPNSTHTVNFSDGEGNSCSLTYRVPTAPPPSCGSTFGDPHYISVYVYDDVAFTPNQWPQYRVEAKNNPPNGCYMGTDVAVEGISTSADQVLSATSCQYNSDCVSDNTCINNGTCYEAINIPFFSSPGYCSYTNKAPGSTCGTTPQGGSMYCTAAAACQQPGPGSSCQTNLDCNDGNSCHTYNCNLPIDLDTGNPMPGLGYCSYGNKAYGTICGTNDTGGNKYCGLDDGICHNSVGGDAATSLCKTAADCSDENDCTQDICSGYMAAGTQCDPETLTCNAEVLGRCNNYNLPPESVCQIINSTTDQTQNGIWSKSAIPTGYTAQKLCSPGTDPRSTTFIPSTCSVDYISCNYAGSNDGSCCGIANVQGNSCQIYCYQAGFPVSYNKDSANPLRPMLGPVRVDVTSRPLAGVRLHMRSTECDYSQDVTTDSSGMAAFSGLPRMIGNSSNARTLKYRISADTPIGYDFTRSMIRPYRVIDDTVPGYTLGPGGTPVYQSWGNGGTSGYVMSFGFQKPNEPWIQTTGGDVHSNVEIDTPGGPE